ncbi:hypothetical protein [Tenacibaculum finnmarkense]|uniref:hypothetical protein n=1 Tax=Tenacibaculum finnmarkense TaxID=2781243 RepID=UPI001EFA480E|nr:hypothetical protein [Tenacibaculum finnmarkense]MCG8206472.1 hypothetical protein [Tenacibaculum finnmarkense genomovar finnmarkense]MCG8722516.1 hypothetical protein [Tenacibaculum finnmarkense]MCG8740840.1 hypothetical protein [Tenacibaculum finnmarkense]MCG8764269.1 hypothetical protein [Tenacibaculum finnmarkense]MCG8777190.1 hypothetical protein [Tenacibaculum finnmarkense]
MKHPGLLIIDTPEDSGIDEGNLKNDLRLINSVISKSEKKYQIILTTGLNKYPEIFKEKIKERFNKEENIFILKERE